MLAPEKQAKKAGQAVPHCRICKNPKKAHKKVRLSKKQMNMYIM